MNKLICFFGTIICVLLVVIIIQNKKIEKTINSKARHIEEEIEKWATLDIERTYEFTESTKLDLSKDIFMLKAAIWGNGDEKEFMQTLFQEYGKSDTKYKTK